MDDNTLESKQCTCGMPQRWVADPKFPVEFDDRLNEYHLVHEGLYAVMRYCFWCGGRLPESKRGSFFTTPSEEERNEVTTLLANTKTVEDVLRILGPPDEEHDSSELRGFIEARGRVLRWEKSLRYSRRWKSLVLIVQLMPDGKILSYGMQGHAIHPS